MPQNTNGNTNSIHQQYQDGSTISSESSSNQWNYNRITTNQQLPSTVDMNAIKAGPSDSSVKNANSSSSSDSNVCFKC